MNENETEMGREQKKSLTKTREDESGWLQFFNWLLKSRRTAQATWRFQDQIKKVREDYQIARIPKAEAEVDNDHKKSRQ